MVFGLFGKSRFPKWNRGALVGRYEAKAFLKQKKIMLDWKHGDEAFALFIPWLFEDQLHHYTGLAKYQQQLISNVSPYLDAPSDAVWTITDDIQPENYLLIGGDWHDNGIGSTTGTIGGPSGPDADDGRAEVIKALIHKTGNDARPIAACRRIIAWHQELGNERDYKKRGGRLAEAWRLATSGSPN